MRKASQTFILIILLLLLVVQTAVLWRNGTLPSLLHTAVPSLPGTSGGNGAGIVPGIPTPTPTPTKLKSGSDTYTISQSAEVQGPKITSLTLDPLDPKKGEKQTITVHSTNTRPVDAVSIDFKSDTTSRTLSLSLAAGDNMAGDWQTSWTVDDTVLYKYILTITANSAGEKNSVVVAPR